MISVKDDRPSQTGPGGEESFWLEQLSDSPLGVLLALACFIFLNWLLGFAPI